LTACKKRVRVMALRDADAVFDARRIAILVKDGHAVEAVGEHTRRAHARHASANDDRVRRHTGPPDALALTCATGRDAQSLPRQPAAPASATGPGGPQQARPPW